MLALLRAGPASADATLRSDPAVAGLRSTRDWPTYMHDAARSGVSGEALALPLAELWVYAPPAESTRAWPDPHPQARRPELPKIGFDKGNPDALNRSTQRSRRKLWPISVARPISPFIRNGRPEAACLTVTNARAATARFFKKKHANDVCGLLFYAINRYLVHVSILVHPMVPVKGVDNSGDIFH